MKKQMYVVTVNMDGENWKVALEDHDSIRKQIRDQLQEAIPVVIMPPGHYLQTIDLEEAKKEESGKAQA